MSSVLWLQDELGSYLSCYYLSYPLITTVSQACTYATKVPTLCLKQPTFLVLLRLGTRLTVAVQQSYNSYYSYNQDAVYGMPTFI